MTIIKMSDGEDDFNPEQELEISDNQKKIDLGKNVVMETGEENEDLIYKVRAKLFRWRNNEWKERGAGNLKFLRHKETKKIRFLLRQDKTLKLTANFYISDEEPFCKIEPHQGSDKMFIFMAYDCSEEAQIEKFVLKLGNAEHGSQFKQAFEDARLFNKLIKDGKESEAKFAEVIVEEKEETNKEEKEKKDK